MHDQNSTFQNAIDNYLLWMNANGFSQATIKRHQQTLKHLQPILANRGMDFNSLFFQEIIEAFGSECTLTYRTYVINNLKRFLCLETTDSHKPTKKRELPEIYEDYMKHYSIISSISSRNIQQTTKVLSDFNLFLMGSGIELKNLKIVDIDNFLNQYTAQYATETIRKIRSTLRGFLRYLHFDRGILKKDLASMLIAAPVFSRNNPPKFLRRNELQQLFAQTHSDESNILTDAMLYLAYCTGLRPSEIARITLDDIQFSEAQLIIPVRKGRNPVQFSLPEDAIKAIAAYIIHSRPQSARRQLFLNRLPPHEPISAGQVSAFISARVKQVRPDASAYWLRHTYAQNLLEGGASIYEIKEMLGHDDIKTTSRYLHIHTTLMRKVLFDETI